MGMAIKRPVIVMALYDIGRDNWNSFTLSYNTYLEWMKNTLSLKAKFVIYTEEKFIDKIKKYRKEFDPDFEDTILINLPLEELDCFKKYYDRLSDLMFSDNFKKKVRIEVPEMTQPLYNVIMFNKLNFLKDAKDKKYFDNDFLIWADAGGLREAISNYKNEVWPCLDKVNQLDNSKVTFFSHSKNIHVENKEYHALSQIRYIQGTAFMAPSNLIDDLTKEFNQTIEECLENKYIGSDEKIFDITYCRNPDKYNLIRCTWRTYFNIFKENSPDLFDFSGNQSNKVFIDLGAYECGSLRQKINELNMDNSWEVHVFEPNPLVDTKKYAEQIKCCRIITHKKAAWIRDGKVIFNQYGQNGKSQGSLLEETGAGRWYSDYYGHIIVESIDISKFIKSIDKDKEIYLFMDIEHSEYELLEKMIKEGWPNNIKKIWIEWHDSKNEYNSKRLYKIKNLIKEKGTEINE
jgi:FkbM family methyltransferase